MPWWGEVKPKFVMPACLTARFEAVFECVLVNGVLQTCESEWTMHAHVGYGRSGLPCKAWAEVCTNAIHRTGHRAAALTTVWGCRITTDFLYKSMTVQWRTETDAEVKTIGAIPRLELRAQFCHVFAGRKKSLQAHSCSALAREEQVNCTSDAAGAFLGVFQMSWQLIIIWELQAVCPLLLSLGESSTRSARKLLIIGKEVRFVLVVACSDHLQPVLNLTSGTVAQCWMCCCCVSGLTLVDGWGRSAHLGRLQSSLSGFSSIRTHFQFARAEFGMEHSCAGFSGISCLISCSHHICPSFSNNLKSMPVIK